MRMRRNEVEPAELPALGDSGYRLKLLADATYTYIKHIYILPSCSLSCRSRLFGF
jgi:hypothetical protein